MRGVEQSGFFGQITDTRSDTKHTTRRVQLIPFLPADFFILVCTVSRLYMDRCNKYHIFLPRIGNLPYRKDCTQSVPITLENHIAKEPSSNSASSSSTCDGNMCREKTV